MPPLPSFILLRALISSFELFNKLNRKIANTKDWAHLRKEFKFEISGIGIGKSLWRVIALGLTDSKLSEALHGRFTVGTTKEYTLAISILLFRKLKIYTDNPRKTKNGLRPVIYARNLEKDRIVKNSREILKELLDGELVIPEEIEDIKEFITGLLDFDGYIHGKSVIICRDLNTIKGKIIEKILKNISSIKLVKTRKYPLEVPVKIPFQIRKYIYHIKKRLMYKERKEEIISKIVLNKNTIEKVKKAIKNVVLEEGNGRRIYVYTEHPILLSNILRRLGIKVRTYKNKIRISGKLPEMYAFLKMLGFSLKMPKYLKEGYKRDFEIRMEKFLKKLAIK